MSKLEFIETTEHPNLYKFDARLLLDFRKKVDKIQHLLFKVHIAKDTLNNTDEWIPDNRELLQLAKIRQICPTIYEAHIHTQHLDKLASEERVLFLQSGSRLIAD